MAMESDVPGSEVAEWRRWGAELRARRKRAGLSLAGLGRRIHRNPSHLSKIERGERRPLPDLPADCDRALAAGGALEQLYGRIASCGRVLDVANSGAGTTDSGHDLADPVRSVANPVRQDTSSDRPDERGDVLPVDVVIDLVTREVRRRRRDRAPAGEGLETAWDGPDPAATFADLMEEDAMDRRQFVALAGANLTVIAHSWLLDPARVTAAATGRRADAALVADFDRLIDVLRRMDDTIGGPNLLPALRGHVRVVADCLKNSSYTESVGAGLYRALADLLRLAGWAAHQADDLGWAQRYYMSGLRAAQLAGDPSMGAVLLATMANQASHTGDPRDALRLAESAVTGAGSCPPAVLSKALAEKAIAHAHLGDTGAADHAADRAVEVLAGASVQEAPSALYWYDRSYTDLILGEVYLTTGRLGQAERSLREGLSSMSVPASYTRASWMTRLAVALATAGRVDQACAVTAEADDLMRSHGAATRFRTLHRDIRDALRPYEGSRVVAAFDARYADMPQQRQR
jgi:hypothetical protein